MQISYDEMLELASLGAGVMHNRSIEFAKKFDVPIRVSQQFLGCPRIDDCPPIPNRKRRCLRCSPHPGRSAYYHPRCSRQTRTSFEIFKRLADRKITVDMIVQNIGQENKADISFTVPSGELKETLRAVNEAAKLVGASGVTHDDAVAKVSVVGRGNGQANRGGRKDVSCLGRSRHQHPE